MKSSSYIKKGVGLILLSLIGKALGLLKQFIIAWTFGANNETDIYFVADGAVAMIAVVVSGAISVTLLSYYSKMTNEHISEKRRFIGNVTSCNVIASLIIMGFIVVTAKGVSRILAPSFNVTQIQQLSRYVAILSVTVVILISSAVCCALLEGEGCFFPTKAQNLFLSLSTILISVLFYKQLGIDSIMFGYILGFILHYIFSALLLNKKRLFCLTKPRFDNEIKQIFKMAGFVIIGNSAVEINHVIDKMIATGLQEGSVSALYYGQIISTDIVTAVLVHSISAILLRDFSQSTETGRLEGVSRKVEHAIGLYFPISIILIIVYFFYSNDFIALLLFHGNFDETASNLTRIVVVGYLACFATIPIKDIIMKTHYAMLDTKRPMVICIIESICNIIFSVVLSRRIGLLGIALGTSISSILSCMIFTFSAKRYLNGLRLFKAKEIFSVVVSSVIVITFNLLLKKTFVFEHFLGRLSALLLTCVMFFCLLCVFRYQYFDTLFNRIKMRKEG